MTQRINRDDYEKFQDYGCWIPKRIVYFGGWISFFGDNDVDSHSGKIVTKSLLFLDNLEKSPITLYLNSPGGEWWDGMALYDTIKSLKSPVTAICLGHVMSMGTILLQACKERYSTPYCTFMIHDGYDGFNGTSKDFEAWGEFSKKLRNQMYEIYYEKMKKKDKGVTKRQIETMCSHDCILTSQEAVKVGLVDKIVR